ncbi:MAG: VanW family protein [Candidatus Uhrbacteria bacterium GW2011_GWE2_45_35]|uniref:VanW family protein n=2 Tax=Candidatus Uhriibacteriota TaxID=1752732 RepID=A0A0G1LRU3_9BACT|nr:MAG: VanW family protein [Candidatus Uhrbacteria bacterium GW2011_GWF2_44_350]KKU08793.1 MAG: VanW family protein [Candidatus Uhrbacteria bacterium GW2011_GWE2_45_35]HBR80676.1 hypothetical protein [Candidatus Uhrbacteria bacterium]HCU31173.1 hypothetical protein [Candidatus Uhrbacteria bacterium]
MHLPLLPDEIPTPSDKPKVFSKPTKIALIIGAVIVVIGYAGTFVWAESYENRIAPNVRIGSIKIGGKDFETAKQTINSEVDKFLLEGVQLFVDGKSGVVALSPVSTETGEYVIFDVDEAINQTIAANRTKNKIWLPFTFAYALIHKSEIKIPVSLDEDQLTKMVLNAFPDSIQLATDADFVFTKEADLWQGTVTASADGLTIPTETFFSELKNLLVNLDRQPIVMSRTLAKPTILENQAEALIPQAEEILNNAPYTITFKEQAWEISATDLSLALEPILNEKNQIELAVSENGILPLLDSLALEIEKPAVDARLKLENNRVIEFQPSSDGLTINRADTASALSQMLNNTDESKSVELAIVVTESLVKTGGVNDLGIKEVLGVGTSNYRGSPGNRIKNIKNGVNLLNGLLIAPGEEFSLLAALKPFTTENGYLSELVIKGDKIEPEIGGGLCQIGTTTFRAAMNSGLDITNRRNHSLVVSYYNDPTNNNPGTDATIYDPAPDFKFINDTGNYILFQAEIDEATTTLRFSFWGTADGRQASYTPPTVIRWIPVGETQMIETTDLEPGVEQCQSAHVGADTTFIYTITHLDGTQKETVFESHYRPLPKICLIGVEEITEEEVGEETGEEEEGLLTEEEPLPVTE